MRKAPFGANLNLGGYWDWSRITKYICFLQKLSTHWIFSSKYSQNISMSLAKLHVFTSHVVTPNLLSVIDPSSLAYSIAVLFNSQTRVILITRLAAQNAKDPRRGPCILGGYRELNSDFRYHKPT